MSLFKPDAIPPKGKCTELGLGSICCRQPWGFAELVTYSPWITLSTERGELCCSAATVCRKQWQAHHPQNFGTNMQAHVGNRVFKFVGVSLMYLWLSAKMKLREEVNMMQRQGGRGVLEAWQGGSCSGGMLQTPIATRELAIPLQRLDTEQGGWEGRQDQRVQRETHAQINTAKTTNKLNDLCRVWGLVTFCLSLLLLREDLG